MDTHIYAVLGTSDVKVHRMITVLPSSSDPNPPTVNSLTINGGTSSQDTASRTVNLQVNASDVGSGVNSMWVAEFMWNSGLGSWQVINESGWIPYQRNSQWKLTGSPGSRFIDVWVADFAGNISSMAKTAHINLLYSNMWVAQNQAHGFNYDLTVGEHVETQLIPASSDADLYIGTYDTGTLYASYEAGSVVETIIFDAPHTDWYTFSAYGYTDATYSIIINRAGSSYAPGAVTDKTPPRLLSPQGDPPTQMGLPNAPIEDPNFPIYLPLIIR